MDLTFYGSEDFKNRLLENINLYLALNHVEIIKSFLFNYYKNLSLLTAIRDVIFISFIYNRLVYAIRFISGYGLVGSIQVLFQNASKSFFAFFLSLPPFKKRVEQEVAQAITQMRDEMIVHDPKYNYFNQLPSTGLPEQEVMSELLSYQNIKHNDWKGGKVSGAVYHGGDDLIDLQTKAFHMYCVSNQLHPDVFPGVRKMESEVVSMVLNMFNAPKETGCGATTSGGTESLLLACLSAREYGRKYKGITEPEIIAPASIHAGVDKAAFYFGIKLHHIPLDKETYKVDMNKLKKFINSNTILICGSAPNFPHGIIDPIDELSELAVKHKIPLHVDCCLGSFIMPFMEKSGFEDVPLFDFRLPGVTSISCDTHKYGFAPKGSSIIMYRNEKLRECQYFVTDSWMGGLYGSPGLAGSKNGAVMVGCWATMVNMGEKGYIKSCQEIINTARKLKKAIQQELKELKVIGDPIASVVSFTSDKINIYALADKLNEKGWHLSALQKPPALHLAVTKLSIPIVDDLVKDLKDAVQELISTDFKPSDSETAALYGVAGSVKTTGVASKLIVGFLDTLYKT
ncbi:hypothetical protein PACTADRAFT_79929 [Pachysolen tannophilus NRRL Y-2460]|uniref:sphinganine-1-phosphate aldolase n=1 Tax=Pachysolen tannophilus NRRL Y-2460 TaxID=669874 RepID=A0A1E4TVM2_PACTA|nr:hypothetical protein PACTADRAFT_79929 [Pachysolen tannophilus NRRL Y-2460]